MEGNISSGNLIQVNNNNTNSYRGFGLQSPARVHHHQQPQFISHHHHHSNDPRQGSSPILQPTIHENFPLTMGANQDAHPIPLIVTDYNKPDCRSDEDDSNIQEDAKGKKSSLSSTWHRVKWTDTMVKLLITAVSYISEETSLDGSRRKFLNLQKKGKWKSVSKVMAERGHIVSPQQCEDKFNDLNKRYKRLNEILGRGTTCEVVENPTLLDLTDHVSEKAKDEVRKILSSKHLHYEEMCSYHNGNRLHLAPDPELQHSLRLALRSREDYDDGDLKKHMNEENDEIDDQEGEFDDHGEFEENVAKRVKQSLKPDEVSFKNTLSCNVGFDFGADIANPDAKRSHTKGHSSTQLEEQRLHIEEQRLQIEEQMLELEMEKFKWQRFCQKKDREMEATRMEIERMKLENERMGLELRRKEMGFDEN